MFSSTFVRLILASFLAAAAVTSLSADHAWGPYHWARTSNPFTLTVINSTTPDWDGFVGLALNDWSGSSVVNMVEEEGVTDSTVRRKCQTVAGKIRICNLAYGNNGWLGIAGISINAEGHIVTGYTKLNDSYFGGGYYSSNLWKQSVTCQELGHNLGLDHQDESFYQNDMDSCMDYQDPPFDQPNSHDYQQLAAIYDHLDAYNSYDGGSEGGEGGGDGGGGCNAPPGKGCNKSGVGQEHQDDAAGWGISLGRRGNREKFMRIDADGTRHITFVLWAEGRSRE